MVCHKPLSKLDRPYIRHLKGFMDWGLRLGLFVARLAV